MPLETTVCNKHQYFTVAWKWTVQLIFLSVI